MSTKVQQAIMKAAGENAADLRCNFILSGFLNLENGIEISICGLMAGGAEGDIEQVALDVPFC